MVTGLSRLQSMSKKHVLNFSAQKLSVWLTIELRGKALELCCWCASSCPLKSLGTSWSYQEVSRLARLGTKRPFVYTFLAKYWKCPGFKEKETLLHLTSNGLAGGKPLFALSFHYQDTWMVMSGLPLMWRTHKSQSTLVTSTTNNEESKEIKFQAPEENVPSVSSVVR